MTLRARERDIDQFFERHEQRPLQPIPFENSFEIVGTGAYVPERVLTNQDFFERLGITPEWIAERTGIHERRTIFQSPIVNEGTAFMASRAAEMALERAKVAPSQVGVVIVSTSTPDRLSPSTASTIQTRLGLSEAWCFDLSAGCSGFLYALKTAAALLVTSRSEYALVIGSESLTRTINWNDPKTAVLFGDAAGAMVIRKSRSPRPEREFHFESLSDEDRFLTVGEFNSSDIELHVQLAMNGREVFRRAVTCMAQSMEKLMASVGVKPEEIRVAVVHQANQRILESVRERCGFTPEQVPGNIHCYGNTGSASIPLLYHSLRENGAVRSGDWVLFSAFGAGFAWGSLLYRAI